MAEKKTKLYLEMQMEELEDSLVDNKESVPKKKSKDNSKNAEIAKMYEDVAEYEEDLKGFEEELEIVNANTLQDMAAALTRQFPDEDRDYAQELKTTLEIGWTHFVEVENSHPKEQLDIIKETEFGDIVDTLNAQFPEYNGDFETEVRALLVKRWENLIAIKKEHIKEEIAEIKTSGLKPKFVKRVYEEYHGITK